MQVGRALVHGEIFLGSLPTFECASIACDASQQDKAPAVMQQLPGKCPAGRPVLGSDAGNGQCGLRTTRKQSQTESEKHFHVVSEY